MSLLDKKIKIGKTQLNTRLVMAPVDLKQADHGKVTEKQVAYYEERTRGGHVGLVVLEQCYINLQGRCHVEQLSVASDDDIEGLAKIAAAVHKNGSKIVMQISHGGAAIIKSVTPEEGVSPSGIANPNSMERGALQRTHAMDISEIEQVIADFLSAARRAQKAGFDGVEIHSAHGYLLNQFYSPLTNKRTDAYTGQTIEGRTRLQSEIVRAIRAAFGPDFLLGLRLGACDYDLNGGSTIEDGVAASKILAAAGLDFIDITGGMNFFMRQGHQEEGYFADSSAPIKEALDIPVILTGGIKTREAAEKLLAAKSADLIGAARAVVADAAWPQKIMSAE